MLTPQTQQKIITALLKRPENQYCSDCNCKTPCWASLDFGVFVCMNCSGAHRALGPSTTRVRSTKLDTWNKDWLENMKIGNSILNQYWENQLSDHPSNIKPNVNSSLNDIKKYVYDKYVKRKFVDPEQEFDPLTKVKKGIPIIKTQKQQETVKPTNDTQKFVKQIPAIFKQTAAKDIYKKHQYQTVKQTTLPFNKQDVFKKVKPTDIPQIQKSKKIDDDLLQFHHNDANKQIHFHQIKQAKKFEFNFGQAYNDNSKGNQAPQSKQKQITFDNFLQNISNKSDSSSAKVHQQQPIHGNYFMSPQGFVNSSNSAHYPHHGFSLPSHPQPQPQVTMNINMNMYPNVMNINMGTIPNYNSIPEQGIHHSATQNKQFQYNDFFTGNISPPPPQSQNITLQVTLKEKNQQQANKQKSWVDDWM